MHAPTLNPQSLPTTVATPVANTSEPVSAEANISTNMLPMKSAVLKTSFASLALQVPEGLKPARCTTRGEVEDLHTTCDFSPEKGMARMATVSIPADKDTFIPWSWHQEVVEMVRAMAPVDSVAQLGTQFEQAAGAKLTEVMLLPTEPDAVSFGIVGHVAKIKFPGGVLNSSYCAMSFAMAGNRPAKIIFCSAEKTSTIAAMRSMASSFQVNNKSLEMSPDSFMQKEHDVFFAKISSVPDLGKGALMSEEETYQREAKAKCAETPQLSRRRYQCLDERAKERWAQLEPPVANSTNSEQLPAQTEPPAPGIPAEH